MLTAKQNELLMQVADLLNEADVLLQKALGASDECYYIHTQIENAADDVLDAIRENNPEDMDAE